MNDLSDLFGGVPFDPFTVEPQGDFPVLKPGKYPVLIEKAEVKVTKKGTGHLISLDMKILEGEGKGQHVFDNINIQNPSTQCVEIGLRTLSALARAIGLQAVTSTTQLLNQVVIAHVKVKDEQNSVRTYSATTNVAASAAAAPAPVAEPKPTTTKETSQGLAASVAQSQPQAPDRPVEPAPQGLPWER